MIQKSNIRVLFCFFLSVFLLINVHHVKALTKPVKSNNNFVQNANEASVKQSPDNQNQSIQIFQEEEEDKDFKEKLKEQRKLELENSLIRSRLEKELLGIRAEMERLRVEREAAMLKWEIEQEKKNKDYEQQIRLLNQQRDVMMAEVGLSQAKLAKAMEHFSITYTEMQNKMMILRTSVDQIRTEIDQKKTQKERANFADNEIVYLDEPLRADGKLVLSDRVVPLNGIISKWKANYIIDKIAYFNNKDNKKPIFIVITYSPGGSTMAGLNILQAMESSKAPVYVVVTSFAASMAALLTSLAQKSYIYPNALLLHHQPSISLRQNLNVREIKERMDELHELWGRLGGRLAKKMGISLEKLDKQLYEKSAIGDWQEYGDNAKKIKWVDHVIQGVENSALCEIPEPGNYTFSKYLENYFQVDVDIDKKNAALINECSLPALAPPDFYYLYNPNGNYKVNAN